MLIWTDMYLQVHETLFTGVASPETSTVWLRLLFLSFSGIAEWFLISN